MLQAARFAWWFTTTTCAIRLRRPSDIQRGRPRRLTVLSMRDDFARAWPAGHADGAR